MRWAAGLGVVALMTSSLVMTGVPQAAQALTSHVFFIDSLANDASDDVALGDGECRTAANTCSLRAALQEANALPAADPVTITVADGFSGEIRVAASNGASNRMATNTGPNGELGAVYVISRTVTIDLQNQVSINGSAGQATATFRITAPNVQIRNLAVAENSTAFSLSAAASGSTFDAITCGQVATNMSRCLALANATNDVTIRRSLITGLFGTGGGASIRVGTGGTTTIRNLTVDRVRFVNTRTGTATQFGIVVAGTATTLPGLRIVGSTFEGFGESRIPIDLTGANVTDGQIVGNQFIDNGTGNASFPTIMINTRGLNSVIANNSFINAPGVIAQHAIRLGIASSGLVDSGWRIQENYFNGYRGASVFSGTNGGLVTIERNTFGPASFGGGTETNETNTGALVSNGTTNQSARTWFPTAVAAGPEPCTIRVSLAVPTANAPTTPVSVDVYATAGTQAETYLGRATGLTTATDVVVPFSGAGGNIRVQTVGVRGATSQYSRVLAVPPEVGNCAPAVTLNRAPAQESPTSYRDVVFDAQFSESIPLDLTPASVDLTGTTAPGARVVRVERLTPSSFRVVAHADASGIITATLPAGAVVDGQGNPSSASASTVNSVDYVSPLSLDPAAITVTKGGPGEIYAVNNSILAREPISINPASEHPEWIGVGPEPLQVPSFRSSGEFTVNAPQDGQFTGDRTTLVRHVVTSGDENFDGLILDPIPVTILDPNAPDAGQSSLVATPGSRVADGTDAHTVTATARSAAGVALRNVAILFQAPAGVRLSATSCVTGADGTCAVTATSTVAASFPVSASIAGTITPAGSPVTLSFVAGPPDLTRSTLASSVLSLPADGLSEANQTVTLYDAQGNRITAGGENIEITATAGTLTVTQDRGDGTYDAVLTAPTAAGETVIGFTIDGQPGVATLTIPLVAGQPSPAQSTIEADPSALIADGAATSTVRIRMFDSFGNSVTTGGAAVAVNADLGSVTTPIDLGNGTYEATYTAAMTAGRAHLTFTVNGALASANAQIDLQAGPASPVGSTITVAPTSIPADGHSQAAATVELRDINGNRVDGTGHRVDFVTTAGTLLPNPIDNGDGTFVTLVTAPVDPGTATISFLLDDMPATQTAALSFVVGDADPAASTVAAAPTSIPADGLSTSRLTVTLRDSVGNPLAGGGDGVLLSASDGTISPTTDNGDGTYFADLTSSTTATTSMVTFTINGVLSSNTAAVEFLAGAAEPGRSTIEATPETIRAGGSEAARIDVTLRDQYDNVIPADRDRVDFTTTLGDLTRVDPQSSTAQLTSIQSGTAVVGYLVNDVPFPSTASVTVIPGAGDAARSSMTITPTLVVANGVDSADVTVVVRDASGNAVTSGADVQIAPSWGDVENLVDNGDGTWTASLSANWSGTSTVTFTVNGVQGPDVIDVTFVPGPVDLTRSLISVDPAQLTADGVAVANVLVTLLDANGNLVTANADVQVVSSLGTVTPDGQGPDGTWSASLTGTVAGTATVGFTVDGVAGAATATVALVPGAADVGSSTIAASPVSLTADGLSSSTVTVRLFDVSGNALVDSGGTVVVATDLGVVGVVTDNGDGTYTATLTAGVLAGTATLTFTLDGVAGTDTATVTLVPGAADVGSSTIAASPVSLTADGLSSSTVTVRLFDVNGNALTASGGTVVVATDLGVVGAVTDNSDGTYTTTLTAGVVAGTANLTFALDGVAGTETATVSFVAGAADLGRSTIVAAPTSITADGVSTSAVTVRLFDVNGNALTASGGTVVVATDLGVVGGVTDNGDGTYAATLTAGVLAGTATLTFTLEGVAGTDNATVALVPGAADAGRSTIVAAPISLTADGVSTSTVTVRLFDANDNALTASGGTVVVATDLGVVGVVTDNGDGTYTATLTAGVVAGTATLTFTLDGVAGTDTATVALVPGAADPGKSTITASPTTLVANGTSTSTVTVQLLDVEGNLVTTGGPVIVVTTDQGLVTSVTDNGDGTYTATLTSPTTAGTGTVGFTLDGITGSGTVPMTYVAGAANATQSTIEATPTSITADGASTSTITVQLKDAFNNPLTSSGGTVVAATDQGAVGGVTDNGDGTYTATLTAGIVAGTATLTFTLDGIAGTDTATVALVPGAADAGSSTIVAAPTSLTADGVSTSTVTVRLFDVNGNALTASGGAVVVATDQGAVGGVTDNGDGTYTATLTAGALAGTATLTFTLDGVTAADTATVNFVAGAADLGRSTIVAAPTSITADGVSASTVTVRLLDANGNALTSSGGTVVVATDQGAVGSVTDNGDGTYTATLTAGIVAGTATLTFTLDGVAGTDTATVALVPGAADADRSTIVAAPTSITADGVSTSTVTVRLFDANDNALTASGGTVAVATDLGVVGAATDNGDGTYIATFTAGVLAGTATLTFTLDGVAGTDTATVALTPGPVDLAASTIVASPVSVTADGASAATVVVTLRDQFGNPVADSHVVDILASLGTVSGLTALGDGGWTATVTSTRIGVSTLSFTIDGAAANATTAVIFTAGAASPQISDVEVAPSVVVANGLAESTVTVRVLDVNGNPVRNGVLVTLRTSLGTLTPIADLGDGRWQARVVSTVSGTAVLTARINGVDATDTAEVRFVPGPADARYSTLVAEPHEISADGLTESTVTLTLLDAHRNRVFEGGQNITMATTAGTLGNPVDQADGTWTAVLRAPTSTTPPAASVSFAVDGTLGPDTALVAFLPGVPDGDVSTIAVNPAVVRADGVQFTTVTVDLRDAFGNSVSGAGDIVNFSASLGTVSAVNNAGNGTYTATLTSTVTGTAQVSFTVAGALATPTQSVTFVPGPVDPASSTISATPGLISANGVDTAMIVVTAVDAFGNRINAGGDTITISPTAGTIGPVQDTGDGTYVALLTSGTTPGTSTLTFTVNGSNAAASTVVTFAPSVPDAGYSVISAAPAVIGSEPGDNSLIRVTLYDAEGLRVTHGGDLVAVQSSLGTTGPVADLGDGTYEAVLSSPVAGVAVIGFRVNGALSPQEVTVVVDDTTPPAAPTITLPAQGDVVRPRFAISGTGEPLAAVTVSTGSGNLCSAVVGADGTWTCVTSQAQPAGTLVLRAAQTDPAGNLGPDSADRTVTIGRSGPSAPEPDPTDGRTVSGAAEPGTSVWVTTGARSVVCVAQVAADGLFSCAATPPQNVGVLLTLVAVDSAGNVSPEAFVRVGGASIRIDLGVIKIGDEQEVTGMGFLPGELVAGTVYSTPLSLGTLPADAAGNVTVRFAVDAGFSPGIHTVTLVGERSGTVSATFEVLAAPPTPPPGDGLTPKPVEPPGSPSIANTGAEVLGLAVGAVALLLGGFALWGKGRRRSRS